MHSIRIALLTHSLIAAECRDEDGNSRTVFGILTSKLVVFADGHPLACLEGVSGRRLADTALSSQLTFRRKNTDPFHENHEKPGDGGRFSSSARPDATVAGYHTIPYCLISQRQLLHKSMTSSSFLTRSRLVGSRSDFPFQTRRYSAVTVRAVSEVFGDPEQLYGVVSRSRRPPDTYLAALPSDNLQ